jgi:hypothetical protein
MEIDVESIFEEKTWKKYGEEHFVIDSGPQLDGLTKYIVIFSQFAADAHKNSSDEQNSRVRQSMAVSTEKKIDDDANRLYKPRKDHGINFVRFMTALFSGTLFSRSTATPDACQNNEKAEKA